MNNLTLAAANRIIEAALQQGRDLGLSPLAVVVVDAGGHPKAMQREDGASLIRPRIALAKAWGAVAMGLPSRELGKMALERPHFMNALASLAEGPIMPVPGGVLIRTRDGEITGAAGVSGDLSDQDEACAVAGILAAGWIPDVGNGS